MGSCQTKPYVPASDEITKKRAEMLKKRYEKTANIEELDWERAVRLAFPHETYVITYDRLYGEMRVSFVQFPDPFRQQMNPRGEPIGPSPLCPADEIALADKEREKEKKEKEKEKA
jgi:hypothetical protein